jgi:hypothetical protein
MNVFVFRADWFADGRSQPIAAKAPLEWVCKFISESEFQDLFGGYSIWRSPVVSTADMPGRAIGVWGRRNVSRYRRILRERGADFTVVNDPGPDQALESQAVFHQ